jgi:hypothetical protein
MWGSLPPVRASFFLVIWHSLIESLAHIGDSHISRKLFSIKLSNFRPDRIAYPLLF